jgi:hypothetical protein
MDPSGILAITSALKSAVDITKGIMSLKNQSEVQAHVIELNSKLIEAQQAIFAISESHGQAKDRIKELEEQISKMNNWDHEKARYTLKSPWPGVPVTVYHLKKSHANGEEPHWLCPNCFEVGRKSVLNTMQKRGERVHLSCPSCKALINTTYNGIGGAQYAEDIEKNKG